MRLRTGLPSLILSRSLILGLHLHPRLSPHLNLYLMFRSSHHLVSVQLMASGFWWMTSGEVVMAGQSEA